MLRNEQMCMDSIDSARLRFKKYIVANSCFPRLEIYSRLNSFFYNRLSSRKGPMRRTMGRKIMNAYHRELPQKVRKAGIVSFTDVIRWMQGGARDKHFDSPYMEKCDPCFVRYDYIGKLESHERDSAYIIQNKLKGRGLKTSVNVERSYKMAINPLLVDAGKRIGIFSNLTEDQMLFLHDRLKPDLDMFGYSFDETSLQAKCSYKDRKCC